MENCRKKHPQGIFCSHSSLYVRVMPQKGTVRPDVFGTEFPSSWRPLHEDLLQENSPRLSTTQKEHPMSFFEEMKPMIYAMKIFGLFPFNAYKSGDGVQFRRSYPATLYSVTFYVIMNIYAYFLGYKRVQFIQNSAAEFDDLMFSLILFIYLLPHVYLLPTHWKEAGKVAHFFKSWDEYQVMYHNVTGKNLVLKCARSCRIRNMVYFLAIVLPIFALAFSIAEHLMVLGDLDWETPFFWYILTIINFHAALWWVTCSAQRSANRALCASLFQEPIGHLEEYRQLWLRLSNLCRQTGNFMFDTYGHLTVLSFTAVTMTLYGALSDTGQVLRHLGLATGVLALLAIVFVVSDSAHRTWSETGPDFCEKLCLLTPRDKKTRKELKLFILTVAFNPPKINLGGFVDIDRAFLVKFASTMVTYLLVLLQFRLGVLSVGGTTAAVTGKQPFTTSTP